MVLLHDARLEEGHRCLVSLPINQPTNQPTAVGLLSSTQSKWVTWSGFANFVNIPSGLPLVQIAQPIARALALLDRKKILLLTTLGGGAAQWEEEYERFDEGEFRAFQNHWREAEGEHWTQEFEQMKDQLSDRIAYSRYLDSLNDQQAQAGPTLESRSHLILAL